VSDTLPANLETADEASWPGLQSYFWTARERYAIMLKHIAGIRPMTADKVFQEWRFCNVHREHDKTTIWFKDNIRKHLTGLRAVEATIIFRWFNRIETGELVKDLLLHQWDSSEARRRLEGVTPVVTGAYMVHTDPGYSKLDGLLVYIDNMLPRLPSIVPQLGPSLQDAHKWILNLMGMGRFTAYEVITDLRWTPVLEKARDIDTWASAGPGCARGLGWIVAGRPDVYNYGSQRDQGKMLFVMRRLLQMSRTETNWPTIYQHWEMREVEHWACEFDKYLRGLHGERLKRRYGD